MPVPKLGWDLATERSPLPGPTAGRVTRVVWTALGTTTAIQPRRFATFSLSVRQFPTDASAVRVGVRQTWSNGEVVEWIDPTVPGGASPLHPAPQVILTAPGSTSAPAVPAAGPWVTQTPTASASPAGGTPAPTLVMPAAGSGPSTRQLDIAMALAGGALAPAFSAAVMAGVALTRRPPPPDEAAPTP
jgi:hypothetical protein